MAYTGHGHRISGTPPVPYPDRPTETINCGGVRECQQCKEEAARFPISSSTPTWGEPGKAWGKPIVLE